MPESSSVTPGVNATAEQYNDLRTDALTRRRTYVFEIKGVVVVGDEQGPRYIVINPTETVVAIKHNIKSGTSATFRLQKNTTDIDAGIVASTSVAEETTITSAGLTDDQVLTLDVTAISGSPENLLVQVITEFTKE